MSTVNSNDPSVPADTRPAREGEIEEDFGAHLRRARERRGISLRQIAVATKISMNALEALERNDAARLPGGIFSRAFVRSYAVEVGLDPEQTVREFLARFPNDTTQSTGSSSSPDDEEAFENRQRVMSTTLWLIMVSIPIAALLIYFSLTAEDSSSPPPQAGVTEAGTMGGPAPPVLPSGRAEVTAGSVATATAPTMATAPDGLLVELRPSGPCWIAATVDGRPLEARVFQPGERAVQRVRRELVLHVGDASNFAFTINNEPGRRLGGAGQVVHVRIDLQNYATFLDR